MENKYKDTTLKYARYYVDNQSTVRQVAKKFGVSKSQIYYRLSQMTESMFETEQEKELVKRVKGLLEKNRLERHIRGGESTRDKLGARKRKFSCTRVTKEITVYTLSRDAAQEYVTRAYKDKKNLKIHYIRPSIRQGYDVCFSYDRE